eukprot:860275-Prymnesium_polylepis.1
MPLLGHATPQDPIGHQRRARRRCDAHRRGGSLWGLSALMYDIHGFKVTSLEFLPLTSPTAGLAKMAPGARLLTGDGKVEVPRILRKLGRTDASRTMVIFDGEKRFGAWATFQKVRDYVALAIFDDTNILDGPRFKSHLNRTGEIWWDTKNLPARLFQRESVPLQRFLAPLNDNVTVQTGSSRTIRWQGAVNQLDTAHFSIVRGGAWLNEAQVAKMQRCGLGPVRRFAVRAAPRRRRSSGAAGSNTQNQRPQKFFCPRKSQLAEYKAAGANVPQSTCRAALKRHSECE